MDAAMNSAVSALGAQSSALATISSNLSNSQTTGYKNVGTDFNNLLTGQGQGTSFTASGVQAVTRQNLTAQGLIQNTGLSTDMAINGNGFFPVAQGLDTTKPFYTRNGAFEADAKGNLILSGTNYTLLGWPTDATGNILATNQTNIASLQPVNVTGSNSRGQPTTEFTMAANFPAEAQSSAVQTLPPTSGSFTDAAGAAAVPPYGANLTFTFIPQPASGANTYTMIVNPPGTGSNVVVNTAGDGATTSNNPVAFSVTIDPTTKTITNILPGPTTLPPDAPPSTIIAEAGSSFFNGTQAVIPVTDSTSGTPTSDVVALGDPGATPPVLTALNAVTAKMTAPFSETTSMAIYDSQGTQQTFPVTWTAQANNTWLMTVGTPTNPTGSHTTGQLYDAGGNPVNSYSYMVTFNQDGSLSAFTPLSTTTTNADGTTTTHTAPTSSGVPMLSAQWGLSDDAQPSSIALNMGTQGKTDGVSQFDTGETTPQITVRNTSQDGTQVGTPTGVSIDNAGNVIEAYSNGQKVTLYKIPVVTFAAEDSLSPGNSGVFSQTAASGTYQLKVSGLGGAGAIQGGALESSNVDTSVEFSQMITAQQAYSAASKVISVDMQNLQALTQIVQ